MNGDNICRSSCIIWSEQICDVPLLRARLRHTRRCINEQNNNLMYDTVVITIRIKKLKM